MIKKRERLSREAFDCYFSTGKRFHSPVAQLIYTPHDGRHGAVVVSKKVAKHAVLRNTIRRRIYELIRTHTDKGVFIFIIKPHTITTPYPELRTHILRLINQATGRPTRS